MGILQLSDQPLALLLPGLWQARGFRLQGKGARPAPGGQAGNYSSAQINMFEVKQKNSHSFLSDPTQNRD
jgi:hypothetical protein